MIDAIENELKLGGRTNKWIYLPEYYLNLYYRITQRLIEGQMRNTIDLATIEIVEEFRGEGYFSSFLDKIEKLADKYSRVVFVESILNDNLYSFLCRRGYRNGDHGCHMCLYR